MRFVKSSCLLLASLTFLGTALAAPSKLSPLLLRLYALAHP